VDGDPLAAVLVDGPAHGSVTLAGDGSFTYTPAPDFNGSDSFTYKASDGQLDSNVATVTITVNPVNDAPVAGDDAAVTDEDAVATGNVLGNDSDVDGDPLAAVLVDGPAHGSVTLAGDGSFTYTPAPDFNGSDSFTYKASDGQADSNVATVTITVNPVNDTPVAEPQAATTDEDQAVVISLTGRDIETPAGELAFTITRQPEHGTVILSGNQARYEPAGNYNGSDSFAFTVTDTGDPAGVGSSPALTSEPAEVSITVNPVNDLPVADAGGPYTMNEGDSLTLDASGSSDPDGDALAFSWDINGDGVFGDATGAWSDLVNLGISDDGTFTVALRVGDGKGGTAESTASLTVINTAPTAHITGATGVANQMLTFTFAATDPSPADEAAGFTYDIDWGDGSRQTIDPSPGNGAGVSVKHKYTKTGTYSVQVIATDKDGATSQVTGQTDVSNVLFDNGTLTVGGTVGADTIQVVHGSLTVTINGVQVAYFADESESMVQCVLVFGGAGDDVILVDSSITAAVEIDGGEGNDTLQGGGGSNVLDGGAGDDVLVGGPGPNVIIGGDGDNTFIPGGGTDTFQPTPASTRPEVFSNAYQTDEDTPLIVAPALGVLANDLDPQGADLAAALITGPSHGTLTLGDDGAFSYTPEVNFNGTDWFTYTASNGTEESSEATVTITIRPVNDEPVVVDSIADVVADEDADDTVVDLLAVFDDVDILANADALMLSVAGNTNPNLVGAAVNGTSLRLSYATDQSGAADVTVRATDKAGAYVEDTFHVKVNNLADLSGRVVDDLDNDGPGAGDPGIAGVRVCLTGSDENGQVDRTAITEADGSYAFDDLRPGTYDLLEVAQPVGLLDGDEAAGGLGGTVGDDRISGIVVRSDDPDATGYDFAEIRPSEVHGLVWEDFNNDGEVDFGEKAIRGATVTLTGTDDRGNWVELTAQTGAEGVYDFFDLRPGDYTLTETQPAGFEDGADALGTVNGLPTGDASVNDRFSGIVLVRPGAVAENYNFGERPAAGSTVSAGQTATIGFWQNKNGQRLINSLNGGSASTQLGDWLAATFPNMYGPEAGANDLTGKTNAQVAEFYKELFRRNAKTAVGGGSPKVDAQVLAVALATYVTNQTLAGTTATTFGFLVSEHGVGISTFNIGSSGAAFGIANGTVMTVLDILLASNARTTNGLLYDIDGDGFADNSLETLLRNLANKVYSAVNEQGGI